jgi:hypothetical protein
MREDDVHDPAHRQRHEGTAMKRLWKASLIAGAATAVVLGGSVIAFANWTIPSDPVVMEFRTVIMPDGPQPSVDQRGKNVVLRWAPKRVEPGVKVEFYVVTRHGTGAPVQVCVVNSTGCKDTGVPAGSWTYTIRTRYGTWEGQDGPASQAVTVAGPPGAPAAAAAGVAAPASGADTAPEPAVLPVGTADGPATVSTGAGQPSATVSATASPVPTDQSATAQSQETDPPVGE